MIYLAASIAMLEWGCEVVTAIPQEHRGRTYRSRTEARWAEFFALTGTQFQYEPEGFKLGSDWYVPDFLLPGGDVYFEVKPTTPNDREMRVALALTEATRTPAIIAMGNPGPLASLLWVDVTGTTGECVLVPEYNGSGAWAAEFADGGGWAVPLSQGLRNCSASGDLHPALEEAGRLQFQKPVPELGIPPAAHEFQKLEQLVNTLLSKIKAARRGQSSV